MPESMEPITECGLCGEGIQGPLKPEGEAWFKAHRNQEHPEVLGGRLRVVREREEER